MSETEKPICHTHISSQHHILDLKLKEVWRYRDLIVLFTKRTFTLTYKQTVLGPAWIFLNPLISSIIYAFVFGGIAGIGTDKRINQLKLKIQLYAKDISNRRYPSPRE